jgi:gamma-glutamyltranspeptidase
MDTTFPWQYYEVRLMRSHLLQTNDSLFYQDLVNFTVPVEDSGTTHLSVIDAQRNAASLTSTVRMDTAALSLFVF